MMYVVRKEHFNAAHRLYNPAWTDERNWEVFGNCSNKNGHGHNFDLEVTVAGEIMPETGFVMDMKVLGDLITREITDKVDHKNLNLDVDFLQGVIPSCENLIIAFWNILAPQIAALGSARLHRIRLQETNKNSVEYLG